jgi:hypothetical protein
MHPGPLSNPPPWRHARAFGITLAAMALLAVNVARAAGAYPGSLVSMGKCADFKGGTVIGTPLITYDCYAGINQLFEFQNRRLYTHYGAYACIEAYPDATVHAGQCDSESNQKWRIPSGKLVTTDGAYWGATYDQTTGWIQAFGMCLDTRTRQPSGLVTFLPCDGMRNEQVFNMGLNGFFRWEVSGGRLVTYCLDKYQRYLPCDSSDAQHWAVQGQLESVGYPGMCLDIPWADPTNLNELIIWPCNGQVNQTWTYWIGVVAYE